MKFPASKIAPPPPPIQRRSFAPIVEDLANRLKVDVCSLYLFEPTNRELELVATHGLDRSAIGYRMTIDKGLTGRVARTRAPLSVKNPSAHPDYHHIAGSKEEQYESYFGHPLADFDRLLGVLVIQSVAPKRYSMSEIEQMHLIGREVVEILLGHTRY